MRTDPPTGFVDRTIIDLSRAAVVGSLPERAQAVSHDGRALVLDAKGKELWFNGPMRWFRAQDP